MSRVIEAAASSSRDAVTSKGYGGSSERRAPVWEGRQYLWPSVTVVILSLVIFVLAMPRDLAMYDEGIILTAAMRVLSGNVPHRDFYANYGPGQYYTLATLFRVFGEHFMVARLYDLVVRATILGVLFNIIVRQCPLLIALIFTVMGGMWFIEVGYYLYPIFPCMLLALTGSYLAMGVHKKTRMSPALIWAGVCSGLTALFRYDAGFFLFVANLASLAVLIVLSEQRETKFRRVLTAFTAYIGGTALVFVPAAILFLFVSPFQPFLADIIDYSTKYYPVMRRMPFPGLHAIGTDPSQAAVYLPVLAAGLILLQIIPGIKRSLNSKGLGASDASSIAYLITFGSLAAMLWLKGTVRVSPIHMLLSIVPSLVVFAVLVAMWWQEGRAAKRLAAPILLLLVMAPPTIAARHELGLSHWDPNRSIAGWFALQEGLIQMPSGLQQLCETGPNSGIARLNPDYARVATYLGAHTRPEEPIFVGLDRHDKIVANPVALYFAAGRLPGTHWHQFDPGLQTRADIQRAMIYDLQRNHVHWVVRDASFDAMNEPNGSAISSGITLLDRYLDTNYRAVAASGKVAIWLEKGQPLIDQPMVKCEAAPTTYSLRSGERSDTGK